jgi:hypothetical protein
MGKGLEVALRMQLPSVMFCLHSLGGKNKHFFGIMTNVGLFSLFRENSQFRFLGEVLRTSLVLFF